MAGSIWLVILGVVGGLGLGYFLGRNKSKEQEKIKALEDSVEKTRAEHQAYREQVNGHFGKTAQLFNQLTHDYRAVYEHLAEGSQALCGDQVTKLMGEVPQKGILEGEKTIEAAPEKPQEIKEEEANQQQASGSEEITETTEVLAEELTENKEESETLAKEGASLEDKANEARTIH